MTQYEKVCKGLCAHGIWDNSACRTQCPYNSIVDCSNTLSKEALILIQEQRIEINTLTHPRILTLEEACQQDVCWLEWRRHQRKPVPCRIIMRRDHLGNLVPCVYRFFGEPEFYSAKKYGKDWRCWSLKPLAEQRHSAAWKNQTGGSNDAV